MSDSVIIYDRLFIAFLEEWNARHPGGLALDQDLQEMIERHLKWARVIGAESVIHRLQRTLELTYHNNKKISYAYVMELIRTTEPGVSDIYLRTTPRDYQLTNKKHSPIILKPVTYGSK